ncbi:MAG: MFS transporter [Candidatus Methanomethyliaceae archaeon]|nr:MFS transporter [Candidatus Methanomethyliaceae archaeon]MDW7970519.1 MFS transporter [Nitrososphaerota archaeon]
MVNAIGGSIMKINGIIKCLISFDFAVLTGSGLITPIFAIFITNRIIGGTAIVVGFASTIYLAFFSITRLASAYIVDRSLSERNKILLSILGTILVGLSYLLYIMARFPWHIYSLQALNGIGTALRYSPFMSLFTRYIDKGQESLEWGMAAVSTSMGQALTAAISGILIEEYGFNIVFSMAGIIIIMSSFIPITIYGRLFK